MKKLFFIFFLAIFLSSCQESDEEKIIVVDNKYSLTVPSSLKERSDLNDDASLQYGNSQKELYIIVIDETKHEVYEALKEYELSSYYSKDIHGFTQLMLDGFELETPSMRKSEVLFFTINRLPAKLITIKATVDNIDAFYSVAYIEGENRYYQITSWTLSENEYKHKDAMRRMINSFREL